MTRTEKAQRISEILDRLYPSVSIPLQHKDPFTLLIAVLLSSQTTDKKVNQVTPLLFSRASEPESMSRLTVREIERSIRTLGLAPTKARNIKTLSKQLMEKHHGEVPMDYESLEALAGVGHKTAAVVRAQAFGIPSFPVDTHIHRLAARWGLSSGKNVVQTERDLKQLFPREEWNKRHLQIIYFGREYCPARGHDLSQCMICSWAASKKRIRDGVQQKKAAKRDKSFRSKSMQ